VYEAIGDISDPNWPPASLWKYDGMSYLDFLRSRGASPRSHCQDVCRSTWETGWTQVSALMVLREDASLAIAKDDFHIAWGMTGCPEPSQTAKEKDPLRFRRLPE